MSYHPCAIFSSLICRIGREDAVEVDDIDDENLWPSVLDLYSSPGGTSSGNGGAIDDSSFADGPLEMLLSFAVAHFHDNS